MLRLLSAFFHIPLFSYSHFSYFSFSAILILHNAHLHAPHSALCVFHTPKVEGKNMNPTQLHFIKFFYSAALFWGWVWRVISMDSLIKKKKTRRRRKVKWATHSRNHGTKDKNKQWLRVTLIQVHQLSWTRILLVSFFAHWALPDLAKQQCPWLAQRRFWKSTSSLSLGPPCCLVRIGFAHNMILQHLPNKATYTAKLHLWNRVCVCGQTAPIFLSQSVSFRNWNILCPVWTMFTDNFAGQEHQQHISAHVSAYLSYYIWSSELPIITEFDLLSSSDVSVFFVKWYFGRAIRIPFLKGKWHSFKTF